MEYGESTSKSCVFYDLTCTQCGSNYQKVKGIIKYAFLFLEYLPCYPVSRQLEFECRDCKNKTQGAIVSKAILKKADDLVFNVLQFVPKFAGIFVLLLALGFWAKQVYDTNTQSTHFVENPKVNDFYHVDYRYLSKNLRPNEKYKIAKVFDITDDMVTVRFGTMFYKYQNTANRSIKAGHVTSPFYFERKEHQFSFHELKKMRNENVLYKAERPIKNSLHGILVIGKTSVNVKQPPNDTIYFPGARDNKTGIAFLQANYILDSKEQAFKAFTKSAGLGFKYGQLNLAEMYLSGKPEPKNPEKALYWLEQASLQSFTPAIKKYIIVCNKYPSCNLNHFYNALSNAGVNYSVSLTTEPLEKL
jgi:hypothetical protein